MSFQSTVDIFKAHVPFAEPAACEGSEVGIPNAIVDLLEADLFPHPGG